jgi:acyl-coenzyme A thioesterase PaaI-like protein
MQRLVATEAPDDQLAATATQLEALAATLGPHQLETRFAGTSGAETHPITGPWNPLAPPLDVAAAEGRAVVTGAYSRAYEGVAGRVHGGFIAAGLDIALGRAVNSAGPTSVTGTLTVKYRKPVPLLVEVRYEGWVTKVAGRKVTAQGTLTVDGELLAEAEGLWIVVAPT